MDNLDTINEKINIITAKLKRVLEITQTPNNIHITADRNWGKRAVHLTIRLDEFSPHKLKEQIETITGIYQEYSKLRETEKKLLHKLELEKVTNPWTL
jgi:predicted component of type VI protein secretion system